jgi:hypothetical protein
MFPQGPNYVSPKEKKLIGESARFVWRSHVRRVDEPDDVVLVEIDRAGLRGQLAG